jgi:membrane protease YdiL (CAAX protease family)
MDASALLSLAWRVALQAGPPPLTLGDMQALLALLAALAVARLVVAPLIYLDARGKSQRDSWWGCAALISPLIAGILYLVYRAPRNRAGPSSWNPWVPCPQCGAPRGWSPEPCPRCGHRLTLAAPPPPVPGYPVPPPGYMPAPPPPPLPPPPGFAPRPGFAAPEAPKGPEVTTPQVIGALLFAILLSNVAALLALIPAVMGGMDDADLLALQSTPLFVLLLLLLQDSILLAVTVDQALLQGRLTRQKMGLALPSGGRRLPWHIGVGLAAGLLTFTFSALTVNFMLDTLRSLGADVGEAVITEPQVFTLADYLLFFPSFVIIAPVAEELFFRGYALGGLAQRGYVNFGLIFSSLLFGLIHLNPFTLFPLAVAGVVLGAIYLRTGSLVAPIVAHATNNFTALTLAYMGF